MGAFLQMFECKIHEFGLSRMISGLSMSTSDEEEFLLVVWIVLID